MAKKKATMTLKDFHGGSIPSDLPLPSAPGVMVRQPDRISFDRPSSWGNPTARSDHRLRPGSAGTARNFEERTLFFTNASHIGRNFDEDERKPLDGGSAPRRTVSDEDILALPSRADNNIDSLPVNRTANRPSSTPTSEHSSHGVSGLYTGRFTEVNHKGVSTPNYGGNTVQVVGGSRPNAWGLRKDSAVKEIVSPTVYASDDVSKMAHASALDKVSSGRWHPNKHVSRVDADFIRRTESEKSREYSGPVTYTKDSYTTDTSLAMHVGKSLTIEDKAHGSEIMFSAYESGRSTTSIEPGVGYHSINAHDTSTLGNYESQLPVPSQTTERPKLKLLPRSKPLEKIEPPVEYKKGFNQPSGTAHMNNECLSPPSIKSSHTGIYVSDQGVEDPKLNLQTRLHPFENAEGANGSDRKVVLSGAHTREMMVLKGRGINDNVNFINNVQMGVKEEVVKSDRMSHQSPATRYANKEGSLHVDTRPTRSYDKRDHRAGVERADLQQKNWRNDNRRNYRRSEEHQQQPASQERPPSPETWRKPVEQPDTSGPRVGKVASPLELAQAFSKSKSDMATPERLMGHRSFTNRSQVPFSRLTVSSPRPQINGH
ncbi:translation initiation factor [Lithospermum erythrorhizon]|uniref:Translation initiation factor n=1 Tax=Lithospermum erythrorhizon TaxID=34254 RepID=A0AAV3RHQ3_LITER